MSTVGRLSSMAIIGHEDGSDAYATPAIDFFVLASLTVLLAWGTLAVLH